MNKPGITYMRSDEWKLRDIRAARKMLALFALPLVATAVGVCIDTRSLNPLHKQIRVGKDGEDWEVLKFRSIRESRVRNSESMARAADLLLEAAASQDEDLTTDDIRDLGIIDDETLLKTKTRVAVIHGVRDPRATKFGDILRRSCFDESLQLIDASRKVDDTKSKPLTGFRHLLPQDMITYREVYPQRYNEWEDTTLSLDSALTGPAQLFGHCVTHVSDEVIRRRMDLDIGLGRKACYELQKQIIAATIPTLFMSLRPNGEQLALTRIEPILAATLAA